jgi:hypothetical protein
MFIDYDRYFEARSYKKDLILTENEQYNLTNFCGRAKKETTTHETQE